MVIAEHGNETSIWHAQATELAEANRILFDHGVLDAFGHVSVRSAENTDRFMLARNMAPALVEPEDILEFGLDGETTSDNKTYLERYIHSEVYKARPDVKAVVHSHSPAMLPFTVTNQNLRPIVHMAGFLAEGVGHFEIRDSFGMDTDLLVRTPELGKHVAHALADNAIALMRGHGSVAVGESLKLAVYRAIYAEVNAKVQAQAAQLGECIHLTDEEGAATAKTNAGQVDRAWNMWRLRVRNFSAMKTEDEI